MFKNYESKPILRKAVEITSDGQLEKVEGKDKPFTWRYSQGSESVVFRCVNDAPVVGDFVVWLDATDVYLCPRAVFLERNVVED